MGRATCIDDTGGAIFPYGLHHVTFLNDAAKSDATTPKRRPTWGAEPPEVPHGPPPETWVGEIGDGDVLQPPSMVGIVEGLQRCMSRADWCICVTSPSHKPFGKESQGRR